MYLIILRNNNILWMSVIVSKWAKLIIKNNKYKIFVHMLWYAHTHGYVLTVYNLDRAELFPFVLSKSSTDDIAMVIIVVIIINILIRKHCC